MLNIILSLLDFIWKNDKETNPEMFQHLMFNSLEGTSGTITDAENNFLFQPCLNTIQSWTLLNLAVKGKGKWVINLQESLQEGSLLQYPNPLYPAVHLQPIKMWYNCKMRKKKHRQKCNKWGDAKVIWDTSVKMQNQRTMNHTGLVTSHRYYYNFHSCKNNCVSCYITMSD